MWPLAVSFVREVVFSEMKNGLTQAIRSWMRPSLREMSSGYALTNRNVTISYGLITNET